MLSAEKNDLIPRTGPGTPAGKLMRCYWQPAALIDELSGNRPVKPVRLLGENLVAFRDGQGRYGLMERGCPHRGTDLAFGRLERSGLRCSFHGWLFDVTGQCLETPAEPEGSRMYANIRQKAYPVVERSGILFAYLGGGDPPALPHFDCFAAPHTHPFAFKGLIACNWLQSVEAGVDSAHTSSRTPLFPQPVTIPMSTEKILTPCDVDIDGTGHFRSAIFTSFGAPVDKDEMG